MRQPITLKIKFKSASLDQFIERYSVDVSKGGIFIRTKEPLAVGTSLKFEFQLQDSSALISGEGTVVWTRDHDPSRAGVAPGMGVRFDKLASSSGGVLEQIIAEKTRRGESSVESRFDAGVRASSTTGGAVKPRENLESMRSLTPLPKPSPGFEAGAEEEFGQESTRVMQDEVVQRLAEKTRGQAAKATSDEQFSDEPTRARSAEEIDKLVRASSSSTPSDDAATREVPVLSSSPPPPQAVAPVAPPPSVDVLAKTTVDKSPLVTEAPKPAPKVEVATPIVATPLEAPFRNERPPAPARRSSPVLPAVLGFGLIAAAGVGYFIYASKEKGGDQHTEVAKNDTPPVVAPPPTPTPTPTPEAAPPTPEPAKPVGPSIAVTSDPAGAQVTVDGNAQPAPTPTTLEGLDPKKSYDVAITLKGFHDWKGKLTPKDGGKLEAKLVANEKVVEVTSTPPGADLLLDGKKVGRTPFTIHKLDVTGDHQVELRHAGFEPQTRAISASDGWEAKDGKDVLPIALTLTALPPKPKPVAATPVKHTPKPVAATPTEATTPTTDAEEKPAEDKPVVEKAAEKPVEKVEKPAEKPVEKPAKKDDKPADDDKAIKTPDFMKGGEGGETQ